MRRALILALTCGLAAGTAEARGHGFGSGHAAHAPRAPWAHKAPGEGHRHRSGVGEIRDLGPNTFHPVKRYKGFSYLDHEKSPAKD
jgi:hypothetical protein